MQTMEFDAYQEQLAKRKQELGIVIDPDAYRNDGSRRTASKRALLQALADNAVAQGRSVPFKANY
ncbi:MULTISPECIES: hypothetical protein [unclassified Minwuia]|uniref:hypothetical protein n=1 Tax=unclassified Minwuia TaxID=2618799 RepID=UPI00247A74C0|nr:MULTISPECIES: hypothetical protein [unclassified Minwuia]